MVGNILLFSGSVIALIPSLFYGVINGLSLLGLVIAIYGAYLVFRQGSKGV